VLAFRDGQCSAYLGADHGGQTGASRLPGGKHAGSEASAGHYLGGSLRDQALGPDSTSILFDTLFKTNQRYHICEIEGKAVAFSARQSRRLAELKIG